MFKLLTGNEIPGYLSFCEGRVLGAVLNTRLLVYGADDKNVMFWYARVSGGYAAASLFNGVFTADYDSPEFEEEAEAFGSFLGARATITPEYFARNGLAVMRCENPSLHAEAEDISPERLKEVHNVLYEDELSSELSYASWLTDISHKLRHGLIRGKCVEADGRIASVALTSGETGSSAVLSGVATLSGYRGRGYASGAAGALSRELTENGKRVYVIVRPELTGFYERIGFGVTK